MTTDFNCGIYQIRNIITGFCYVGQSIALKRRKSAHRYNLKKDKGETNIHLQRSYNKRGKDFFVFEMLIYCEPFELTRYEQFFVDKYKKTGLLYNIRTECVDTCKGIKRSLETKEKIGKANKGQRRSIEIKRKMRKAQRKRRKAQGSVIDREKVIKILKMLDKGSLLREIIEELKIGMSTIDRVESGYYHQFYDLPEYNLKRKKGNRKVLPETRKRLSEAHKGKTCSLATRRKLSESRGINRLLILQTLKMLDKGILAKEIIKELNVTYGTIRKIKNGWYDDIYDLPKKK